MASSVCVHTKREPLDFIEHFEAKNDTFLVLYVGTFRNESIFFDRSSAEAIGRRLLQWAAPHLLEPKIIPQAPVQEPFVDAYDLASHVKSQAVAMARLAAGGQP